MAPSFDKDTTGEEIASHHHTQIHGKTILITGVSPGGLGLQTAKILATHSPRQLILATRNTTHLASAESEIAAIAPNLPTKLLTLDLSSISKVRAAAAELNSWDDVPKIDILINNAGMQTQEFGVSEDGIENHFAVNHIGPWLFTNLVMGKVVRAKGRVVFVSSMAHLYSGVRFEDWNFEVQ
jgi:NAD(P)-dependent dehydrogenase (short-subunit alcohol dehydrogenase family)